MSRHMASRWIILTTALTVAVLSYFPSTPVQSVHTIQAQTGDLMQTALLSGVIAYAEQQPCISLQAGVIDQVYVQPGQQVVKGQRLFDLDTTAQQRALAVMQQARYEQRQALQRSPEAVTALAAQQEAQWMAQETQLRASIESAQIRAAMDGVVEAVYARPGMLVEAGSLLGAVHADELCVVAAAHAGICAKMGFAAIVERQGVNIGAATLTGMDAPDLDTGVQQLIFHPAEAGALLGYRVGDTVTVEVILETVADQVLIPLSAVDARGRAWYVEEGIARSVPVDASLRNGEMVAVPQEWDGRQVILAPDETALTEGCRVREKRTRGVKEGETL